MSVPSDGRYGARAGSPGLAEDLTRCVEEIRERDSRWPRYFQCSRKRGHGPDGRFCKQHDPSRESPAEVRRRERDAAAQAMMDEGAAILERLGAKGHVSFGRNFPDRIRAVQISFEEAVALAERLERVEIKP